MARGYLKPYKSYVFRNKDPVIDKVRTVVQDSGESYEEIHRASGVSTTALYNWFSGPTKRPQHASLNAVLRALGKQFVIADRKRHAK